MTETTENQLTGLLMVVVRLAGTDIPFPEKVATIDGVIRVLKGISLKLEDGSDDLERVQEALDAMVGQRKDWAERVKEEVS